MFRHTDCLIQFELKPKEQAMGQDDVIAGKIKQAKGKVNVVAGEVTGNTGQQVKGKVQQAVGKVQEKVGKATRPKHSEEDDE
jgi:uncharacterized protein YjbJ (UPF0337 family)